MSVLMYILHIHYYANFFTQGNSRIFWSHLKASFDNTPFEIVRKDRRECQFGPHYFKKRPRKSDRLYIQGTRKLGCQAHIEVHEYKLYPDFSFQRTEEMKGKVLRKMQETKLNALKQALRNKDPVKTVSKFFVSLPTAESHAHPTGVISGPTQKMHPCISKKIEELAKEGYTDPTEVQKVLKEYVKHVSTDVVEPSPFDRAYFPTTTDIGNHLYKARMGLQLSKIDQENLAAKVKEWQKHTGEDFHYFRPYKSETDGHGEVTQLLWVHQQKWQQDLMCRYGNQISLIDATYRTMRYELPLFFVCTRTNVGYSIIAQFVVQSESEECIAEALCVLKAQNPSWNPPYFMCDFSDAEISALQEVFPNCTVYGCDFHREQAWTRWVQSRKSGLSREDGDHLLELLRACAWAASGEDGLH